MIATWLSFSAVVKAGASPPEGTVSMRSRTPCGPIVNDCSAPGSSSLVALVAPQFNSSQSTRLRTKTH